MPPFAAASGQRYTRPVRIYLAAAMTNPARDVAIAAALVNWLEGRGHVVPTRHVASTHARSLDRELSDRDLAQRDLQWLATSDVLVAEVSTPSHGVGIEVTAALAHGLPVLLLHHQEAQVSRLLLGLTGVESQAYDSAEEALDHLSRFLGKAEAQVHASSPT